MHYEEQILKLAMQGSNTDLNLSSTCTMHRSRGTQQGRCSMDGKFWRKDWPWGTFVLSCALIFCSSDPTMPAAYGMPPLHQPCEPSDPRMNATHELFKGQHVVWQIPPNPKSVIFLLPGLQQPSYIFFDRGPGCPLCYGLSEPRTAVLGALEEGHAVLIADWTGNVTGDLPPIVEFAADVLKTWTRTHSFEHLPVVGWGHSAGGWVMSGLALDVTLQALVLMCSQGDNESMLQARNDRFPPVFFAYMNNTKEDSLEHLTNIDDVANAEAVLRNRGVPVAEKRMFRRPVSATFLWKGIPCLTFEDAERIHEAMKADGWLDENDYLLKDPMQNDWRAVLSHAMPYCEEFGDLCLAENIVLELKVAYGLHSFTRYANSEIFSWIDSVLASSDALAYER